MNCRVCDSTSLELAVDLGLQPWCNYFLKPEEVGSEVVRDFQVNTAYASPDWTVKKVTHVDS
jgi:hypothetical protein